MESRLKDTLYCRKPKDMVNQAAARSYITKCMNDVISPLQDRVTLAKLQYSQRSLLKANYPAFNELYREFHKQIRNTWNEIDGVMLRDTPRNIVGYFEAGLPDFRNRLMRIVDQMYDIIAIPDAVILDRLKGEIREKYENYFEEINQRCDMISVDSDAVAGEKEYYNYLQKTYLNEIGTRIDEAHDHSSITSLRLLINRHRKHLGEIVDKIERLAAGESLDNSFVLSDLSDDDGDD